MRNCLHHCLHIDWHYVVGPDENNTRPSMLWSHLVEKELSPWIWLEGVAMKSMEVERLKRKQNKSITGPTAWNHTLAKLFSNSPSCASYSTIYCSNCSHLCFFHSSVYVRFNWTLHCGLQGLFYTEPLLMKESWVTEWKRKSAWRIQNFHLLSISYSNVAIML